jgi:hypothetical protein
VISLLKFHKGNVQYELQVNVFFMDAASRNSETTNNRASAA